ncbi:cilium assembly protein DZIP1-like [Erythrolamprus reginae]|uniref:cilium assembly protein DZIP1-like n=1 Tax=Erythrolamprus reginae TaxID=121349 RepID=UPI00396D051C
MPSSVLDTLSPRVVEACSWAVSRDPPPRVTPPPATPLRLPRQHPRQLETRDCRFFPSQQAKQPARVAAAIYSPPPGMALPPFQFRLRREELDWRRLSTVDVDRVAAEVNVGVLQEHLEHVTFCNLDRERCPRCSCPADPLLLKFVRLAQLCLEYLLHSQNYLSAQLRDSQELLRAADAQRDLLAKDVAQGAQELRLLKVECKRRKKMLATQQMMFMMFQAEATSHQCQFCDKAFLNATYLHNHLQRRHSEQPVIGDQKKKSQTYKLQEEINQLKEQLQVTRCQLEAVRHARMVITV